MILGWTGYAAAASTLFGAAAGFAEPAVAALGFGRRWLWLMAILASGFAPLVLPVMSERASAAARDAFVALAGACVVLACPSMGRVALAAGGVLCIAGSVGFIPAPHVGGVFVELRTARIRVLQGAASSTPMGAGAIRRRSAAAGASAAPPPIAAKRSISATTAPFATGDGAPRGTREAPSAARRRAAGSPTFSRIVSSEVPPLRVVPSNPLATLGVEAARFPARGRIIFRGSATDAAGGGVSATMRRSNAGSVVKPVTTAVSIDSVARPRPGAFVGAVFTVRKSDQPLAAPPRDTIRPSL
ncbi:MAG TPA: hypothetical protein VHV78_16975 [Gemmatimonadaceae bacterium]|jgi:hypothetical protein|nr:hypothetical protein [Gemmatimonadaceae bacterium]